MGTCPHGRENILRLPPIAEGSEHRVYYEEDSAHVWKLTKPALFGESYFLEGGRIAQRNCSPLEYLVRLRLWHETFWSAPIAFGITSRGQILSRQQFISGAFPTQTEVDGFLMAEGFDPVKQEYWLWQKVFSDQGFGLGLGDARDENFVKTSKGIVPIDIRVWTLPV